MKTALCYYSRHHGNTRKVLEAMVGEGEVDLIDVTRRQTVRLMGGIAKGRPNARDLENARSFYRNLRKTYERGVQE